MKQLLVATILILSMSSVNAQRYITKSGHINFFSSTPMEDISADNNSVNSALDVESGMFVFKVLMKSFNFEKALMQEHFNENYVESDKFPNATFKGNITNIESFDLTKEGEQAVQVEGKLTIHGVTNDVKTTGTLTVKDGVIHGFSKFSVKPSDYDIKIPKAVVKNIAESIDVTVKVELKELKK